MQIVSFKNDIHKMPKGIICEKNITNLSSFVLDW